jgi:RAT1-interacting protein
MMRSLPLNTRSKKTALKQPKELFLFARDVDGSYVFDEEETKRQHLLYYYFPDAAIENGIDLGAGFQNFKKIPEEQNLGDFGSLLKAIICHEKATNAKINTNVITFRGLMTKILTLPYNLKDPIDFDIVSFDGQIFIKNNDESELQRRTQQEHGTRNANDEFRKKCEYSGYKFETVVTLPKPWAECSRQLIDKRSKKVVSNYEQYMSVVKTGIGKVRLVIAGEVDCIWDYIPEDGQDILPHYVELKTSRSLQQPGQVVNFEKKLFKTWAQCFLLGIRRVIYGFRDDNLQLQSVEIYQTEEIPLLIKTDPLTDTNKQKINAMDALKWYGAVLEWLCAEIPTDDNTSSVWKLNYDPGSRSFNLSEVPNGQEIRDQVISEEFKEWRNQLALLLSD